MTQNGQYHALFPRTTNWAVFNSKEFMYNLDSEEQAVLLRCAILHDKLDLDRKAGKTNYDAFVVSRSLFPTISKQRWSGRKDRNPPYPGILRQLEHLGFIEVVRTIPHVGYLCRCTFTGKSKMKPASKKEHWADKMPPTPPAKGSHRNL